MTPAIATRAAVRAGRVLIRSLVLDGRIDAAQLLEGLIDGAFDEAAHIGDERAFPTPPPHGGGPDALYHYGHQAGWMLRRVLQLGADGDVPT